MIQQELFPEKETNNDIKILQYNSTKHLNTETHTDLDVRIRQFLEKYIKTHSDGKQAIEIKGKLIDFIRNVR